MHICKLTIVNYRNFQRTSLTFTKGVNTVIGENGSGKSNLFRAIRLLLDGNMTRSAVKLDESDFNRGLDNWRGHWIVISLEFDDISTDEAIQALFLHGAAVLDGEPVAKATYNLIFRPRKDIRMKFAALEDGDLGGLAALRQEITIDQYETVFTGRSEADFSDQATYTALVGDFETCSFSEEIDDPRIGARIPPMLAVAKEVSFTFIQALRDVVSEFHNNRTNPLLTLLKIKSGEIDPTTMAPIVAKVNDLNTSIEGLDDVQTVRGHIRETIKDAAGETYSPSSLSIKSDLPNDADKLFQSLRLFVGESEEGYEGAIHELSLGGANLIYLTLKLLEFKYQRTKQPIASFLLIEEPEAHIHTHIQKTLFDRIAYDDTQIIYSTHSTQISEVSKVRSVNILGRRGGTCEAFQPTVGLDPIEIEHIQRYLDAVRSNLLFAKSVCLIEGDAEEILIPILFKKVYGLALDELGISLVNIRSTGFRNVAILFHDQRIRKRCSIITDLDSSILDTAPVPGELEDVARFKAKCLASQIVGAQRKIDLDAFAAGNPWLSVHYAQHTLEVDFMAAGNAQKLVEVVPKVYSQAATIALATAELSSEDKAQFGRRVLTMAQNQGKGWFAILLGGYVDHKTVIPKYITDAIFFARERLSAELFYNIYSYRVACAEQYGDIPAPVAVVARGHLKAFREEAIDVATLKANMLPCLPNDQVHEVLAGMS